MSAPISASEMLARLRKHYIKRKPFAGGVFIDEVGINRGWRTNGVVPNRRCDAIHIGFTSASGQLLTGHEIKVSRSDWLAELDDPEKSLAWAEQCHRWFVVAAKDVVHDGELPPGWGLMVPASTGQRMSVLREAPIAAERDPNWLIVRSLFARHDTLSTARIGELERDLRSAQAQLETFRRQQADGPAAVAPEPSPRVQLAERLLAEYERQARDHQDSGGYPFPAGNLPAIATAAVDLAKAEQRTQLLLNRISGLDHLAGQIESVARSVREASKTAKEALA